MGNPFLHITLMFIGYSHMYHKPNQLPYLPIPFLYFEAHVDFNFRSLQEHI